MHSLGELERSVMDLLWAKGESLSAYDLQARLAEPATTGLVLTGGGARAAYQVGVLKAIAHLQSYGIPVGFRFGSQADLKNSDMEMASLGQGGLGLPDRGYYFNDDEKSQKIRQQYVAHIINMFALVGDPRESATVSAQAVMEIETKLALASLARVQLRDPYRSYHKMKLSEAAAKTPGIDFNLFFAERGAPKFDTVNLAHPEFFKAFDVVLNTTPVSDWQAYLRWHLVNYAAPYLGEPVVKENFAFNGAILTGVIEQRARWKRVVGVVAQRRLGIGQQRPTQRFGQFGEPHAFELPRAGD